MRIVFDIDGTLSDPTLRLHHITGERKDWDAFFAACVGDAPISPGLDLLGMFDREMRHDVQLWTGRPERTRKATVYWIHCHTGLTELDYFLRMRADGDHRPDHIVKLEYLDACQFVPDIIFEDRKSVVDAYRARGLTVYQVAPGEF